MSSWHSKPLPRLLEELDARPGGLSQHQAEERLRRTGPNELEPPPQAGLLGRLLEQMRDPMILVLLGAAGLSLAASGGKEWLDAAIILVIVAVNSVISIFQEDRAQHALEELRCRHIPYRILFLEASAEVLLRRYKETRRRHPLLDECDGCLEDAIREERRLLKPIRDAADYIIDTTSLSPSQLRGRIVTIFEGETTPMLISCQSFGFRNGLPQDADLVFDVRCLPNPYYVPELKEHDGTEGPVRDYVMNAPESHEMLQKLEELLAFSIPLYQREGKSQLVVAVGCTGGRHRSVAIACQLAAYLRSLGYRVELSHRDKDNRR